MPNNRLSARKLSNPPGPNIASSSESTLTWAATEQTSTIGGSGDQGVKLYNPNDFLQAETTPQVYQQSSQSWPAATSHAGAWPQMTSSSAMVSSFPPDNTFNAMSNGAQNGQFDPWAWNMSDSPSPVENSNQQNLKSSDLNSNISMSTPGSWDTSTTHESSVHNYSESSSHANTGTQQTQYVAPNFQYGAQPTYSVPSVWNTSQPVTAYENQQHQQHQHTEAGNMWQSDVTNYHWTTQSYQSDVAAVATSINDHPISADNLPKMSNLPVEAGTDVAAETFSSSAGAIPSEHQKEHALLEQSDLSPNKESVTESFEGETKGLNDASRIQSSYALPPHLSQSASHLFERTDSWLSGSSLQTVNYSVCGSQDMLDASYFMPQETVEEVRRQVESLRVAESEGECEDVSSTDQASDCLVAENNSMNYEVPSPSELKGAVLSENSSEAENSSNSVENNISSFDIIQQNSEGAELLPAAAELSEQQEINDDGIRQPPEGAAAVRPTSMIGAQATSSSNLPVFAASTPVVTQAQFDNSNELANRTPEETENIENLQVYHGTGRIASNKPESYSHTANVFPGMIGIREGSPFKPLPKSTADIVSVIQQELPENVTQQTLLPLPDVGANLEMTPDNAERPSDFDHVDENTSRKSKESSPGMRNVREMSNNSPSTTLWQNPEPKQGNVFLVPAASSTPQQNVLIVPHLSDQQEMLDNPLGSKLSQANEHLSLDNVENVPSNVSASYEDALSIKSKSRNNSNANLHALSSHPDIIQQELPVLEKRTESIGAETRSENALLNTNSSKDAAGQSEHHLKGFGSSSDNDDMSSQGRGQRPPVPGLGPVQSLPRAISEPPESMSPVDKRYNDRKHEPRRQLGPYDRNYPDDRYQDIHNREIAADNYQRHPYPDQRRPSVGHEEAAPDSRRRRDRDHSRDRYREHSRDRHQDLGRDRHQDLGRDRHQDTSRDRHQDTSHDRHRDTSRDRHRDTSRDRHRDSSRDRHQDTSRDKHRDTSRDRHQDYARDRPPYGREEYERYRYRDDPYYTADRDRSRPSSRGSVDYESDNQYHENRAHDYPPQNHHSRSGYDSDRETYYQKHNYEYRDDPYKRDPQHYGDYNYGRYDQNRYYPSYYNDPYYNYSNYNYGYYAELYGSDPRYRGQYTEQQLRDYYSRYAYENSDRRSVQSGRSSVNDELQGDRAKYTQEFAQSTPNQSFDPLSTYTDYSSQEAGYYQQSYNASTDEKTTATRMTPEKFQVPHMRAQFTANGQLIKILPNCPKDGQPAIIEIHDVQTILSQNSELEELKNFPGPLQKGSTHKNDVMQFCMDKLKKAKEDISVSDRQSSALIWELLTLLIRQNGTVVGTDIAELLLRDHEYLSDATSDEKEALSEAENNFTETNDTDGKTLIVQDCSVINKIDEEKVTKKFREYLLFGRKKEALEKAMKNGLWGHALFLASKMDTRTYNRVMTRFANSLKLNDPLQTLYQLMSGRQPASVTCVAEEKWGDWRPHLAMILSNTSNHPEIDHKSITILGDTLATRGCLQAAQFCYLMAGVEFGTYSSKTNKLVLLGSNHSLPFNEFATNEAIQCTEIYEYAQSLGNSEFLLPHFQSYRFIYATRLVEFGFIQEALHYYEVIASHVCKRPAYFHPGLVSHLYELANRLKYFDPHYTNAEGERSEVADPMWLQELRNVVISYNAGIIQQETVAPDSDLDNTAESAANNVQTTNASVEPYYEPNVSANSEMIHSNNANNQYLGYQYSDQSDYPQYTYQGPPVNQNVEQEQIQQNSSDDNNASYQHAAYLTDQQFPQYYAQQDVPNFPSSQESLHQQSSDLSHSPQQTGNYWDLTTSKNMVTSNETFPTGTESNRKGSSSSNRSAGDKPEKKEKLKQPATSSANAGWGIGGLISKFLPKPKNQMKLPDDRNPSIIWDEKLKRWINNDEDEEDSVAGPAAPPSDTDMLKGIPAASSDGMKPPVNQDHNKFRRPLAKGSRQNYVDVVSKSMTTVHNSASAPLFPVTDAPVVNPSQLFIPTTVPGNDNTNNMDPNVFSIGSTYVENSMPVSTPTVKTNDVVQTELSRSSSQSSLAQEVQHYMAPSLGDSQNVAPQAMPMMFNPNQILATQIVPSASRWAGQMGRRYPR